MTVFGSEFFGPSPTDVSCRFGNVVLKASYLTSTSISCLSPARAPGTIQFSAANNAMDFSPDVLTFSVLADAAVTQVLPSKGPVLGGTVISITGSGFTQQASMCCLDTSLCQFGQVVSEALMLCTTSSHTSGSAPLEIWGNAVSSSRFSFVFRLLPGLPEFFDDFQNTFLFRSRRCRIFYFLSVF